MTLYRAVLELDADVDEGTSGRDTGVFEMAGNAVVNFGGNVNYLLASGQGSTLNAITSQATNSAGELLNKNPDNVAKRRGIYFDLGGGINQFDVQFTGWEGADDANVNHMQWGVPAGKPSLQTNAGNQYGGYDADARYDQTGADPLPQLQLLQEFLRAGEYDSRAPHARLYIGEYSTGEFSEDGFSGLYGDWHHVVVRDWNFTKSSETPVTYDGVLNMALTRGWRDLIDAVGRLE